MQKFAKNFQEQGKTVTLKILSAIKDIEEIWIQANEIPEK